MSFQSKLAKKTSPYIRKVTDMHIELLGNPEQLITIQVVEDKYKDRQYTYLGEREITGWIHYPDNEYPITFGQDTTDNSLGLSMMELLPIEGTFKFSDNLNFNDIVLQKVRVNTNLPVTDPEGFRVMALQIVDVIGKASVEVTYLRYQLAPYTLSLTEVPELATAIDNLLNADWIDY